jgi:hypothetical protein
MKTLINLAAAATIVAATLAVPSDANARHRGGAVAAGIIGGIAAGALIGSAIAGPRYYGPGPVYYGAPYPICHWERQWVWDGFGWRWGRVRVCY